MMDNTLRSSPGATLTVTASESVELIGSSASGVRSGLFARVERDGGTLSVEADRLSLRHGAVMQYFTYSAWQSPATCSSHTDGS